MILRAKDGEIEEALPPPFSARSRVHEYGGGEFLVAGDTVYFVNDKDQQVYRLAGWGARSRAGSPTHPARGLPISRSTLRVSG